MTIKTKNELQQKQNLRIIGRVLIAIASGIICQIFLDWKWLFLIISIYCFLEAIFIFSIIRKTQLMKAKLENHEKNLTEQGRMEIAGHALGYAIPIAFGQFILSCLTISIIGTITKLVASLF